VGPSGASGNGASLIKNQQTAHSANRKTEKWSNRSSFIGDMWFPKTIDNIQETFYTETWLPQTFRRTFLSNIYVIDFNSPLSERREDYNNNDNNF